jgi:hypothetical protein
MRLKSQSGQGCQSHNEKWTHMTHKKAKVDKAVNVIMESGQGCQCHIGKWTELTHRKAKVDRADT